MGLDTTAERGSLALLEGDRVVAEEALLGPDGFGQLLFPAIEKLLAAHGWPLSSIDLFAAASGPGSFTGVRVGLAAVKGLAEATGKRAQAVSNLRALAGQGSGARRYALIDARRGEVYVGLYDAQLRPLEAEANGPLGRWAGRLGDGEIICQAPWPELVALGLPLRAVERPLTGTIAGTVALLALAEGGVDPAAIDANYVRRSDADGRWADV